MPAGRVWGEWSLHDALPAKGCCYVRPLLIRCGNAYIYSSRLFLALQQIVACASSDIRRVIFSCSRRALCSSRPVMMFCLIHNMLALPAAIAGRPDFFRLLVI